MNFAKNSRWLGAASVIIIGLVSVLIITRTGNQNTPLCGDYRHDKTVVVDSEKINVEVASDPKAQDKGLGGRPCIGRDQGMLFVFKQSGQFAFWMKDMKFPIDIVWISADQHTVGVERDVKPSTYPDKFINKDKPAQYVLELQANRSTSLHINLGTPIDF